MTFDIVHSVDENTWRGFLDEHPDANVFYSPEMFEVFRRARGHEPRLWAAVDSQGCIQAMLLPVRVTLADGTFSFMTSRNIVYGSELHRETPAGEAGLDALLEAYVRQTRGESLFTELRHLHDTGPVEHILRRRGFKREEQLNYLIDLNRPADAVLQGMNRTTRKGIRRELKRGRIEIVELDRREQLGPWYRLVEMTFQRAAVPLADISLLEAAFDVLRPAGMARFFLAQCEGKPLACTAELYFKKSIYGWFSGMDRSIDTYNANDLIMWHVLRQGAEQGYHVYDFGGAGAPSKAYGVRDYKSKFGGTLVGFGRDMYVHRPALLLAGKTGYALGRRMLFGARFLAGRKATEERHEHRPTK